MMSVGEQRLPSVLEAKPAGDPEGGGEEVPLPGRETLRPHPVAALPCQQGGRALMQPLTVQGGVHWLQAVLHVTI